MINIKKYSFTCQVMVYLHLCLSRLVTLAGCPRLRTVGCGGGSKGHQKSNHHQYERIVCSGVFSDKILVTSQGMVQDKFIEKGWGRDSTTIDINRPVNVRN